MKEQFYDMNSLYMHLCIQIILVYNKFNQMHDEFLLQWFSHLIQLYTNII